MTDSTSPAVPIDCELSGLKAQLRSLSSDAIVRVDLGGTKVELGISRYDSKRVVFVFHGSINRERRTIPFFEGQGLATAFKANVVSIADPSLHVADDLPVAWYAGHQGFAAQQRFVDLLVCVRDAYRASRPVLLGGSSGGFAALLYAARLEGSVAIATNPQTSIPRHARFGGDQYRRACWPALRSMDELESVIVEDLATIYREPVASSIVVIQSSMDPFHLQSQLAPFVASLHAESLARTVVQVGFWGRVGHSGSVPSSVWKLWVRAALRAESTSAIDLLTAHERIVASRSGPAAPTESAPQGDPGQRTTARELASWARAQVAAARDE